MNKRIIGSLAAGGVVFAGAYAFAATMSLSSDTLGADDVAVTNACDATVSYKSTAYSATTPAGYRVTEVTVTPSGAACDGKSFKVTLANGDTSLWDSASTSFGATAAAKDVTVSPGVVAANVTKAFAVVAGPAAP